MSVVIKQLRRGGREGGFSLPEAVVAMTLVSLAASALLLASYSALGQVGDAMDSLVAHGIAAQLMDEIAARPVRSGAELATKLMNGEAPLRLNFRHVDDYDGYTSLVGPVDPWGIPLGQGDNAGGVRHPNFRVDASAWRNWRVHVSVSPVSGTDLTTATNLLPPPPYRLVEISILRHEAGRDIPLANLRRVLVEMP